MRFETKIAVVLRDDLQPWQALNVTAFTVGGLAATQGVIGEPYVDGSGVEYLPMINQPVVVFAGSATQIREVFERARVREINLAIYTEDLFTTGNDIDNRAAVRAVSTDQLDLVGLALCGKRRAMDRVLKGLSLHP